MFPFSKEIRVKFDDTKIREFRENFARMRIRFRGFCFRREFARALTISQESSRLRTVHTSSLRRCNENLVQINCD